MARKFGEASVSETPVEATSEATATAVPAALPATATTALTATTVATAHFDKATKAATAQFDKATTEATANMEKAMKTAEEMVTFGQGNLEALVKSSQIWAAGVQDLGKQVAASAQAQVDQTMATLKALAGVKSLKDALDLQSTLARSSVEKAVAETSKLTDASLKLAEQTLAPITARLSLAAERFVRPV